MTPLHLQQHLLLAGHSPGDLDGKWGPRTRAALVAYQRAAGLDPDGIPGPLTDEALFAHLERMMAPPDEIPTNHLGRALAAVLAAWESRGARETGENRGPCVRWICRRAGYHVSEGIPWCGLTLVAAARVVTEATGMAVPDVFSASTDTMGAKARKLGRLLTGDAIQPYDLALYRTAGADADYHHVGVVLAAEPERVQVIAGNTGDRVATRWTQRHALHGVRL